MDTILDEPLFIGNIDSIEKTFHKLCQNERHINLSNLV